MHLLQQPVDAMFAVTAMRWKQVPAALDAMALDRAFPETKGEKLATLSAFCASNATQAVADDSVTDDA